MKVLQNHTLLYDADCPLCNWYTAIFIRYNFLDANGRMPFTEATKHFNFDLEKAKNKIALINKTTGTVYYGIDSLVKVLGNNFVWMNLVMRSKPLHWLVSQFYAFISYNRKIVIPSNTCNSLSCTPTKNWFWRIMFILFCMVVVSSVVNPYFTHHLIKFFNPKYFYNDAFAFMGQLIFQTIFCFILKEKNIYDYIGHVSFVSFLGALLLQFFSVGLNIIHTIGINITMLEPFCYGVVFCFMFFEHRKRLKITGMQKWLTLTWILYRLAIYPIAFIL